jgi:type IV secretory pathway VirD2 relaxase
MGHAHGAIARRLSPDFKPETGTACARRIRQCRRFCAGASILAPRRDALAKATCDAGTVLQIAGMTCDSESDFRIHIGRVRSRPGRTDERFQPFVKQVEAAIRKAGGNPNRIVDSAGKRSGRFNARGRGAKLSFPSDGGGWQRDSGGRFRARRVVVKARVVKLNPRRGGRSHQGSRGPKMPVGGSGAATAHLRYLERDGVTRDGDKGHAYSALEDHADGRAFVARGQGDRHHFRFIVAAEDGVELATELGDLRGLTRDLMRQVEQDLDTRLDWIAVDHHNTGHPHTHIIVRGVTGDGKILNIAGDYIAHGIRHRASELVTRELGHQSEIDVAEKLASEVDAERLTRLDRMLIAEQREHGFVDLWPDKGLPYLVRENRYVLIDRVKRLEGYGLAAEAGPGRWIVSDRAEAALKALEAHNDTVDTIHRTLADHGLANKRGVAQYVLHGAGSGERVAGRVIGKGLAGDEMGERVYLVVDGVDGRVHHMEFAGPAQVEEVRRGMIVEAAPAVSRPRNADRNIALVAEERAGIYEPGRHLQLVRDTLEQQGKDPDAFIRSHLRRLEALRRAGHVERIDADHWRVPGDVVDRGMAYDLSRSGDGLRVRILSPLGLEQQVGSDGATWLDRELAAHGNVAADVMGFGREVAQALEQRAWRLAEMGHARRQPDGTFVLRRNLLATLERQEVERVGREMAGTRGLAFLPVRAGEYVSGKLVGSANLASGRFAMIDNGIEFSLVPWQDVLDRRIGQHIGGIARDGGIEWSFGRKRGLGL